MKSLVLYSLGYFAIPYSLMLLQKILHIDAAMYRPALSWGYMTLLLAASKHRTLLGFIAVPQLLLTVLLGLNNSTFSRRTLQLPAAASAIAYLVSVHMPEVSSQATLAIFGFHMHVIIVGFIRFMILPAPFVAMISGVDGVRASLMNRHPQFVNISSGGFNLDAALWINKNTDHPERWLVYLGGNGEMYEHSFFMGAVPIAKEIGANAIMHNVRGVARSGGITQGAADMEEDCCSVIRYILDNYKGTKEKDILLFGHSIGGNIATTVVAKKFKQCPLVIDRTFTTLSEVAASVVNLRSRMGFVKWAIDHAFGDMDTVSALHNISHDRYVCTFHRNDQVIPFAHGSLGRIVEGQPNTVELTGHSVDPHNSPTTYFNGHAELVMRMNSFFK